MKVIGSPEEIGWARQALLNNCENCPFERMCTSEAVKEQTQHGEVHKSCQDFMGQVIEFIVENNNI